MRNACGDKATIHTGLNHTPQFGAPIVVTQSKQNIKMAMYAAEFYKARMPPFDVVAHIKLLLEIRILGE